MAYVTITLDDSLLKSARRVALEMDISLTELIRRRLREEVDKEQVQLQLVAQELKDLWKQAAVTGQRNWTRDELHER
jgi:hypothetical protein